MNVINSNNNGLRFPRLMSWYVLLCVFLLALWSAFAWGSGVARIADRADPSKATYEETVVDLRVKVLGGYVSIKRMYGAEGWELNPSWRDLEFKDGADNTVRFISGSVSAPERDDNTVYVGDSETPPIIRTLLRGRYEYKPVSSQEPDRYVDEHNPSLHIVKTSTGYRWSDREGNWIEYNLKGVTQRYGDKNNVTVSFERDSAGRIVSVKDHFGETAVTFDYSATGQLTVTDYGNRKVIYHGGFPFITKVTDVRGNDWHYHYKSLLGHRYLIKKIDPLQRATVIGHEIVPGGYQTIEAGGAANWGIEEVVDPATGTVTVRETYSEPNSSPARSYAVPSMVMYTHRIDSDGGRIDFKYYYNQKTKTYSLVETTSDGISTEKWYAPDGKLKRKLVSDKVLFTRVEAHDGSRAIKTDIKGLRFNIEVQRF